MSSTEIRELYLYIVNTEPQYRQAQTIMDNLAKKVVKGTYDETLALKAWQNLADRAASQYDREYGSDGGSMKWISKADRTEVAKQLQEHFQEELDEKVEKLGGKKASLSIRASIDVLSGKSATADSDEDERAKALLDYLKEQGEVDEDLTVEDVGINGHLQIKEYTVGDKVYRVMTSDEAERAAGDEIEEMFKNMGSEEFAEVLKREIGDYLFDINRVESFMENDIKDYVQSMDDNEVLERCLDEGVLPDREELEEKLKDYISWDLDEDEAVRLGIEWSYIESENDIGAEDGVYKDIDDLKDDLTHQVASLEYEELIEYCSRYNIPRRGAFDDLRGLLIDYLIDQNSSDPVGYFRGMYGEGGDWADVVKGYNLLDINKVIDEYINADGVASFMAIYDGRELDLGNDLYAYRVD